MYKNWKCGFILYSTFFRHRPLSFPSLTFPILVFWFFFSNEKYIRFHKDFNCNYNPIPCNDRKTLWRLPDEIIFHLAPNTLLIIMKVYLFVHIIIRKVCRSDLSEKIKFLSYIFSLGGGGMQSGKPFPRALQDSPFYIHHLSQ